MPEGGLVVALGDRRYEVERRWCRTSGDEPLGFVSDLVVDSKGFVHVGCRGAGSPVLVFDPSGTLVRSWGRGQVADVHYMSIDEEDLILLADRDAHQVLAFDADGTLRFALGERHVVAAGQDAAVLLEHVGEGLVGPLYRKVGRTGLHAGRRGAAIKNLACRAAPSLCASGRAPCRPARAEGGGEPPCAGRGWLPWN